MAGRYKPGPKWDYTFSITTDKGRERIGKGARLRACMQHKDSGLYLIIIRHLQRGSESARRGRAGAESASNDVLDPLISFLSHLVPLFNERD